MLHRFKLDITEVLVDLKKFFRAAIWQEYWHNREKDPVYKQPIFKSHKSNLPKNHPTPSRLKVFLNSIRPEIMDPQNLNQEKCKEGHYFIETSTLYLIIDHFK